MFKKISYLTSSLVCASFFSGATPSYGAALNCDTVCQADACGASQRIVEACRQQCGRNPVMKSCMSGARKAHSAHAGSEAAPEQDPLEGGFGNMFDESQAPAQPMQEEMNDAASPEPMQQQMPEAAPAPAHAAHEGHSSEVCVSDVATQHYVQQAIEILQGIKKHPSESQTASMAPEMLPPAPPPPPMPKGRQPRRPAMDHSMPGQSFAEQLQNGRAGLRKAQPNQRPEVNVNDNEFTKQLNERRAGLRKAQPNQRPEVNVNDNEFTKQLNERRAGLRKGQPNPRPEVSVNDNEFTKQLQNGRAGLRRTTPNPRPAMNTEEGAPVNEQAANVPLPPPPPAQRHSHMPVGMNHKDFAEHLNKGRQNLRSSNSPASQEIFRNKESKSPLDGLGRAITKGIGGMTGQQ